MGHSVLSRVPSRGHGAVTVNMSDSEQPTPPLPAQGVDTAPAFGVTMTFTFPGSTAHPGCGPVLQYFRSFTRSGIVIRIGDVVKAIIAKVDLPRRELDLRIADLAAGKKAGSKQPPRGKQKGHQERTKKMHRKGGPRKGRRR